MKLNLPVPNRDHVEKFKKIVKDVQGIELSDAEALDQCSRLVQYMFLTEHALPALRLHWAGESNGSPEEGTNVQVPLAELQGSQPEESQIE